MVENHWNTGVLPRAGDVEINFAQGNALATSTNTPRALQETTNHELGFILAPRRWDDNSPTRVTVPGPGLFWGVSARSNNIMQAIHLLEFLQTDPVAVTNIALLNGTPTNPRALEVLQGTFEPGDPEYYQMMIAAMSLQGVDEWIDRPSVAGMPEADAAWRRVFEEFIFEVIDLETYLERVVTESQNALNEFFIPLEVE